VEGRWPTSRTPRPHPDHQARASISTVRIWRTTGSTMCGLAHSGVYPAAETCQRRNNTDPTVLGMSPSGLFAWRPTGAVMTTAPPPTRRAKAWSDPRGIVCNGERWVGDVPGHQSPTPRLPFLRVHHAWARRRRAPVRAVVNDGFPEHYESNRSAVDTRSTANNSASPVASGSPKLNRTRTSTATGRSTPSSAPPTG